MNPMDTAAVTADCDVNSIHPALHHDPGSARWDIEAWEALHREEQQAIHTRHSYFYTAGRVLLGLLFVLMACDKLFHFNDTVSAVAGTGYAGAFALVGFALSLELFAGVMLAIGLRVRLAAGWLSVYLTAVTFMFNWDQSQAINRAIALANIGFVTALLMVIAHGAGRLSIENWLDARESLADRLPAGQPQPVQH